jgi:hypothetical protein
MTQRRGLLIPAGAEISQKGPDRGHLGGREHASGSGWGRHREILEALPTPVNLLEEHGDMLRCPGEREVLLQRLDLVLQLAPLMLTPPELVADRVILGVQLGQHGLGMFDELALT